MDRISEDIYSDFYAVEEEHEQEEERQHDSGCALDMTPDDDNTSLTTGSRSALSKSVGSKSTLSRRERCRKSFGRLRKKSAMFLKGEIRPSCLKSNAVDEVDSKKRKREKPTAQKPIIKFSDAEPRCSDAERKISDAKRRGSRAELNFSDVEQKVSDAERVVLAPSAPAIRHQLVRQSDLSSCDSLSSRALRSQSLKSVQSEFSEASENQGIIWVKERSTPSPSSTPPVSLLPTQVMSSYQQALSSVVNPLGSPDRSGFTKEDLVAYLQELFEVDRQTHEAVLAEIQNTKPTNVVLNVTLFEAKDLKPCGTAEATNPSCVLGIYTLQSPSGTPSSSPCVTPSVKRKHRLSIDSVAVTDDLQRLEGRASITQLGLDRLDVRRTLRKRTRSTFESEEFKHSETAKATVNPVWNERFEFNVNDINSEALHLFIWHQPTMNQQEAQEKFNHRSRPSFKSLFRHLRLSQDGYRNIANCLGQIRIPLREIPTSGTQGWYQLFRDERMKMVHTGQVRIGLHLSFKSTNSLPRGESNLKEFLRFVRRIYDRELGSFDMTDAPSKESSSSSSSSDQPHLHQLISQQTIRCVLSQYAQYQNISPASQKLLELAVILDSVINGLSLTEQFLAEKISSLSDSLHEEAEGGDQLTTYEKDAIGDSISAYLRMTKRHLTLDRDVTKLFPPSELNLEGLQAKTSIAKGLMNILQDVGSNTPGSELVTFLTQILQNDIREWLIEHVESVQSSCKDPVLEKTRIFVEVLKVATTALTPQDQIAKFFSGLSVDYYRVASVFAEAKISSKAKELTLEMDKYQVRYHRFNVNISESSIVSLQHYFALRDLYKVIRSNVSERELFRISLSDYQNWFKVSVTFWLQTFREQCLSRMETALKLDKDMVQVTSLVKHSNSSVDVLSCCSTMTTEWREIDFADTDIALLGVTKITDTICDCVKAYMDKVIEIMEHNGYYDYIDNQQFDVTDRLCISLNNISHLRQYLSKLSTQLNWDSVTHQLSLKHESDDIGEKALQMLHSLVETTDEEMLAAGRILAKQIIDKMAVDLEKYTMLFTRCPSGKTAEVEPLLVYLERNMEVLFQKLESNLFPLFWEEIWKTEVRIVSRTLLEGRPPSYYKNVSTYLESLRDFFQREGVENCRDRSCKLYCNQLKVIEMNSLSSEQLMLLYYKSLTDLACAPSDYYGHLVIKVGFRQKTDDSVSVYVSVIQAKELPGMTNTNLSNPLVTVSLCPQTMFPDAERFQTPVQKSTVNPVYGENFEFASIADVSRRTDGAVILFSAWHYVPLFANDFLGEVVIPLNAIRELVGRQTVDDLPAIMVPLRRPKEPRNGPYKVLKDRSANDKVAQALLNQRNKEVVFRTRCNLCKPVKCLVSTLTGKKLEVIGKQASISTE